MIRSRKMVEFHYIGVYEDLPKHCNPWDVTTVNGKNYIFSGSNWFDADDVAFADIGTDDKLISFVEWVASEVFSESWEDHKDAFAELARSRLAELDVVYDIAYKEYKNETD